MKKLCLVALVLVIAITPLMGCRALMMGTAAGWQAVVGVIDPVDSGHFWSDFGDYLSGAGNAMRKNLTDMHRTIDRHILLYDWDDPTL